MLASVGSLLATLRVGGRFVEKSNESRAEDDLQALLFRMRQLLYSETLPVLAYFWLKTVCESGYSRRQWKQLSHLLKSASCEPLIDDASREVLIGIHNWIQERVVLSGQRPASTPQRFEPARARLNSEGLTAYVVRLLNGWLPMEVARMLIDERRSPAVPESGIPVQAFGIAIERLLVREHPSRETLETLLQPGLLSPEYVYPADLEILRDAVLWLLGRTWAPAPSVMPATLLCVAPNSHLPMDYREAVRQAFLIGQPRDEEVHVPIAPAQANEIEEGDPVGVGSVIVTMDGRWWQAEKLRCSEQHFVVYRPVGRLRIDYSEDHARLRMPWPDSWLRCSGDGCFRDTFKIFGREWRVSKWEMDTAGSWIHLVVSRAVSTSEIVPGADTGPWRLRPASVDMA